MVVSRADKSVFGLVVELVDLSDAKLVVEKDE